TAVTGYSPFPPPAPPSRTPPPWRRSARNYSPIDPFHHRPVRCLHRLCTGRLFCVHRPVGVGLPHYTRTRVRTTARRPRVTSTSATHRKDATPQSREVATVSDLWRLSDATGIPASAILRALDKLEGADAEGCGEI